MKQMTDDIDSYYTAVDEYRLKIQEMLDCAQDQGQLSALLTALVSKEIEITQRELTDDTLNGILNLKVSVAKIVRKKMQERVRAEPK